LFYFFFSQDKAKVFFIARANQTQRRRGIVVVRMDGEEEGVFEQESSREREREQGKEGQEMPLHLLASLYLVNQGKGTLH
jgi:hypothetical protein